MTIHSFCPARKVAYYIRQCRECHQQLIPEGRDQGLFIVNSRTAVDHAFLFSCKEHVELNGVTESGGYEALKSMYKRQGIETVSDGLLSEGDYVNAVRTFKKLCDDGLEVVPSASANFDVFVVHRNT